ncbi:neuroblast differentiation-associated protein AHNAK-like [Coregonus clupeaformis]|uniref:neuroblast differentiation-associated protein AHNAK-like n=1 Tax=Coregonus clupeaformis TaxID=59861 RepID=UPI001E1C4077|nr:neuroblast differentiation-associated protein AHNAK-like [Coregonus clupeaformis]
MKKPRMSFGRFSKPEVKAPEVDVSLTKVDISLPEGMVEVKEPDVEMKSPEVQMGMKHDIEIQGQGSKFKLPKFGFSLPKVKGPEIGLSLSKTDVDVDLPEGRADLQLPDVEVGVPSVEVEIPESGSKGIDVKIKKPRMSFPKFGFSKPEVKAREVDINIPEVDVSLPEGKVEVKEPEVEMKTPHIQVDVKDTIGSPSRFIMPTFKFPKFGASSPNVKIQVSDLEKDIKVHGTEIPKVTISAINIEKPSVDLKGPSIDADVNRKKLEIFTLPEIKTKVQPPSIELKLPSGEVEIPEGAATEIDVKMKKPRMSFGWFSKPEVKAPEVDISLPEVDISLPEGKVEVKEPEVEMKTPESQVEMKNEASSVDGKLETPDMEAKTNEIGVKKPLISFPKIVFSRSEMTAPEIGVIPPNADISLPEGKVVKVPEVKIKAPEIEVDIKDVVGSPSRFKMSTFKFPKFGATSKVVVDVSDKEKDIDVPGVEILDQVLGASFPVDLTEPGDTVDLKGCSEVQLHVAGSERPSVEEGMAIADVDVHDVDISKLTIDDKGHGSPRKGQGSPSKGQGSPSKFKLPTFKMPRLSSSKSKPKNEHEHDDICPNVILDNYEIQVEPQGPEKSPKLTLATFGEVLRSIDVEFDVPTLEDVEEKLTGSREEITASRKTELNAQPSAETQSVHEEEEAKEKSKFVWFKFPTFGLSSPSESAKILEKETSEKEASEKSPAGDSVEQDASLTFSVQSSDAFADISSTVTSEQVGPSLAFPTKVTVKYSDPIATEIQGNIITSTARTKMISFEPYLAEKVTIPMSSGASSSSVDTLKLESGTHIITSNIQAIPDTQKATLLTDFGLQTGTAGASYASWSVDDTNKIKSDGQTVIKRHVVRKMSGTDRETVVITRRAEPISDETASSIKQMKETMHSEKMKFFDGAELE